MKIQLDTVNITRYNEEKHKDLLEEFSNYSKSKFIHNIEDRLLA